MWIFFDHTTHAAFPGKFAMAAITTDHASVLCLPMAAVVADATPIRPFSMGTWIADAAVIWPSNPAMWAWGIH
jgi:hypothetical protein